MFCSMYDFTILVVLNKIMVLKINIVLFYYVSHLYKKAINSYFSNFRTTFRYHIIYPKLLNVHFTHISFSKIIDGGVNCRILGMCGL